MRKITRDSVEAMLNGENFKRSNTEVEEGKMYLFGYKIAEVFPTGIVICTCNHNTRTTKERLNGFPNVRLSQKKGELYLNGEPWDGEKIFVRFQD